MKALQFTAPDTYQVTPDLPVPAIGDDEVLLAARSVGVWCLDIEARSA